MYFDYAQYKQKGFAPILIILGIVLLAAAVGGAFYVGQSSVKAPVSSSRTPVSISPTQTPVKTSINPTPTVTNVAAGEKTYTNTNLKYSLNYPNDWSELETDNGNYVRFFKGVYSPNLPTPETYISILSKANPSKKSVRDWLISENILPNPNDISTHTQEEKVLFGGISGIAITTPVNGGQKTVYLPVDKNILQITYVFTEDNPLGYDSLILIFEQILTSLKFSK